MGFFYQQSRAEAVKAGGVKAGKPKGLPVDTLRRSGCAACPRNKQAGLDNPKMEPYGDSKPLIYFLDSIPSSADDKKGAFLSDKLNDILFDAFPGKTISKDARFGAVVQCATGVKPEERELECCRGRVVADIEQAKPLVVVGLGAVALRWATGLDGGVGIRRGRLIPTKIGNHACWYLAMPEGSWMSTKKGKYRPSEHELLLKHEVKLLMRQIRDGLPEPVVVDGPYDDGIEFITGQEPGDLQRLEQALLEMAALPEVAIDYETNDLRPYRRRDPKIYLVSVGTKDRVVVFPIHYPDTWLNSSQIAKVMDLWGMFLLYSGTKIAHNLHMEQTWSSYFWGMQVIRSTQWADTMAQAHTIDERAGTLSLDDVVRMRFGFFLKAQSRVDPVRLLEYSLAEGMRYNGMDSKWCFAVYQAQKEDIAQEDAYQVEYDRKVRLIPTLVATEAKGLPADREYALDLEASMRKEVETLKAKLYRAPEVITYGKRFGRLDPASPEDVLKLMRDICKRPEIKVEDRDGTRYTTDEDALSKIPAIEVPSAQIILDLRQVEKLLGTYIEPILSGKVVSPYGLIHSTYKAMHAVTGRLAAEDPNVQNFPKRKRTEVRGIIYAPDGSIFAALDYGQIEARVIAMASEDRNLVDYLWTGYDIHGVWADKFLKRYSKWADYLAGTFGLNRDDEAKIRKTGRQEAKNKWVFPQFFGSSFKSCARDLHIPEDIAEELAEEFWKEFAGVLKWQKKLAEDYERNLYVETLTGRRRRGAITKNELINTPVQGTAADIVTRAMCELSEMSYLEDDPHIHPNLNVHDDLSTIMPTFGHRARIDRIAAEMCKPRFDFINVPLIVEASTGQRWNELKEIHVYRSNEIYNHVR